MLISHVSKVTLGIFQAMLQKYINWEFPYAQKLGLEKAGEFQENIYCCFINCTKAFDNLDHNKLWKIFKRWEYQTTWPDSWESCMEVKKQLLELDMKQQTGSK